MHRHVLVNFYTYWLLIVRHQTSLVHLLRLDDRYLGHLGDRYLTEAKAKTGALGDQHSGHYGRMQLLVSQVRVKEAYGHRGIN